jgi:hypothetical protein
MHYKQFLSYGFFINENLNLHSSLNEAPSELTQP